MPLTLPVPPAPERTWSEVSAAFAAALVKSGERVEALSEKTGIAAADIEAFADGTVILAAYEIEDLASALDVRVGTWLAGDEWPMFRKSTNADTVAEAVAIGTAMMTEYLAVEALA